MSLVSNHQSLLRLIAPKRIAPARHLHATCALNRYFNNRHRDPKYKLERTRKVWKVELPDFDKMRREEKQNMMNPDEIRSKMKEKGIAPPNPYEERENYLACSVTTIDPYQPSGDGKSSRILSKLALPLTAGKDKVKTMRELSTIRSFIGEDFDLKEFAKQSTDIYVKAHEALAAKDERLMFEYVTEHCFPLFTANLDRQTIIWKYLGDIEQPEVVQVRTGDMMVKSNKYGQITVRFHTKQTLAIFDRHGRLIHGSPTDVKEVFEYIVFEMYLADEYGRWRMHDRIVG